MAYVTTFGDRRIPVCLATVEFLPTEKGTGLILAHQGAFFEGADGPQIREEGWRELLDRLAKEWPSWAQRVPEGTAHGWQENQRQSCLPRSRRPHAPGDRGEAQRRAHFGLAVGSGLVRTEKAGRVRTCHLEPAGLSVAEHWIGDRRSLWERRLDRLSDLLAESEEK